MLIGGLQKNSLIDFPGRVSAVIFTIGCNFSCPYCHNPSLVTWKQTPLSEEEIFIFLKARQGLVDGVVISGGEPTLQRDLVEFCIAVKEMDFDIKLDTNGTNPAMIQKLIDKQLLDYVAMDLKADPSCYPREIAPFDIDELQDLLQQSMHLLATSNIPCEFRTTCAAPFINEQSIAAIAKTIAGQARSNMPLFLQKPDLDSVLDPNYFHGQTQPDDAGLENLRKTALGFIAKCEVR